MILNPFALLNRRSEIVRFESEFDVPESVRQLGAEVRQRFQLPFGYELQGVISETRVIVARLDFYRHNSSALVFLGSFKAEDGKTILEGSFGLHKSTRIFGLFFMSYATLILVGAWGTGIAHVLFGAPRKTLIHDAIGAFAITGFWLIAMAFFNLGRWWARGDPDFIAKKFHEILSPSEDWNEPVEPDTSPFSDLN